MLQVIFGDDEHTAADGPYVRVLKTRKWLYLLSIGLLAISFGLYDADATKSLLHVLSLPAHMLAVSAMVGLSYLGTQYALLVGQLWTTYDIVLDERLTFRRADELATATEQEDLAREAVRIAKNNVFADEISTLQSAIDTLEISRHEILSEIASLNRKLKQPIDHEGFQGIETLVSDRRNDVRNIEEVTAEKRHALAKLRTDAASVRDPGVLAAVQKLEISTATRMRLAHQVPSARAGYVLMEKLIDFARIAPPAMVAGYAMFESLTKILLV